MAVSAGGSGGGDGEGRAQIRQKQNTLGLFLHIPFNVYGNVGMLKVKADYKETA